VIPDGVLTDTFTGALYPFFGFNVTVVQALHVAPEATLADAGLALMVKSATLTVKLAL